MNYSLLDIVGIGRGIRDYLLLSLCAEFHAGRTPSQRDGKGASPIESEGCHFDLCGLMRKVWVAAHLLSASHLLESQSRSGSYMKEGGVFPS